MSVLSHLPKALFLKTTTSKPTEKLTICYILFLLLSEHLMCCQSFEYTLGKAEGYGWELLHAIVQLVYASVFCANTIRSRYWGHTLSSYISISHSEQETQPYTLWAAHTHFFPCREKNNQLTNKKKATKNNTKNPESPGHQDFLLNRICKDHTNFESRLPENPLFQKYCKQETSLQPILPFISQIIPATILHSSCTAILSFPPWNHLQPLHSVAGVL